MLKKWIALLLLCVSVGANASEVELAVGGTALRYQMPSGYVRVSEQSPPLFGYLEAALPPTNRLVEAFYTPADIQTLTAGGGIAKDTYFMVQAIRSIEHQTVASADWRGLLSQASAGMGKLDVNAEVASDDAARNQRLSKAAGVPTQAEFGKVSTPQIYRQTDDEVRFIMFVPLTINSGGKSLVISGTCTGAMVLVRNKPILVYAYRTSSTSADIEIARQELATAVEALAALNPSSEAVATTDGH